LSIYSTHLSLTDRCAGRSAAERLSLDSWRAADRVRGGANPGASTNTPARADNAPQLAALARPRRNPGRKVPGVAAMHPVGRKPVRVLGRSELNSRHRRAADQA